MCGSVRAAIRDSRSPRNQPVPPRARPRPASGRCVGAGRERDGVQGQDRFQHVRLSEPVRAAREGRRREPQARQGRGREAPRGPRCWPPGARQGPRARRRERAANSGRPSDEGRIPGGRRHGQGGRKGPAPGRAGAQVARGVRRVERVIRGTDRGDFVLRFDGLASDARIPLVTSRAVSPARASSVAIASAVCGRFAGSFERARITAFSTSGGMCASGAASLTPRGIVLM